VKLTTLDKYVKNFFNVKTHKEEPFPFRPIIDETGTWQKELGRLIQKGLNLLDPNDPFLVKNTEAAVERLKKFHNRKGFKVVSFDAKDMFFNMDKKIVEDVVETAIASFGAINFQNQIGLEVHDFISLLKYYLNSSVVEDTDGETLWTQKSGIPIGSMIASRIADLFMGRIDRAIKKALSHLFKSESIDILRFVDDYLVIYKEDINLEVITREFNNNSESLEFTVEDQDEEGRLQFLDLLLIAGKRGICWRCQQRKAKSVLPFSSSHSRSIKVGVVKGMMRSSVTKSCQHECQKSLEINARRLDKGGYPRNFIMSQIRNLATVIGHTREPFEADMAVVAIQYTHNFGHRIKKLAREFEVRIVFKYKNKLGGLPARTAHRNGDCPKSGHGNYVQCTSHSVYAIPMSCNKYYVGQTYRCVNKRLYEHDGGLKGKLTQASSIKEHRKTCKGCKPLLKETVMLSRNGDRRAREAVESAYIRDSSSEVISNQTMGISKEEADFILRSKERSIDKHRKSRKK
jgi:hypothetical protein